MKKLLAIFIALVIMAALTLPMAAMQIFIQVNISTGSEYIALEVEPTDRIEDIKDLIFERTGITPSMQILTFGDRTLEEGNTLQDYSIQKDSTIKLTTRKKLTTITYQVAPTYTVTIPAAVTLGESATISAENVVVEKGKQVEVILTDANDFKVTTAQGAALPFSVKNGDTAISEGDTILAVNPTSGKTGSASLTFSATEEVKFAGDYTATLVFTIAVRDDGTI